MKSLLTFPNVFYWNLKHSVSEYCNSRVIICGISLRQKIESPLMYFLFRGYNKFLILYDNESIKEKDYIISFLDLSNCNYQLIEFSSSTTVNNLILTYPLIRLDTVVLDVISSSLIYISIEFYEALLRLYILHNDYVKSANNLPFVILSYPMLKLPINVPFYISLTNDLEEELYNSNLLNDNYYYYNNIIQTTSQIIKLSATCKEKEMSLSDFYECLTEIIENNDIKQNLGTDFHSFFRMYFYLLYPDFTFEEIPTKEYPDNILFSYDFKTNEICNFKSQPYEIYKMGIIYSNGINYNNPDYFFLFAVLLSYDHITYENNYNFIFKPYVYYGNDNEEILNALIQIKANNIVYVVEKDVNLDISEIIDYIKQNSIIIFHTDIQVTPQCNRNIVYMGSSYNFILNDITSYIINRFYVNRMYFIQENSDRYLLLGDLIVNYYKLYGGNIAGTLLYDEYTIINIEKISLLLSESGIVGIVASETAVDAILSELSNYLNTLYTYSYYIVIFSPIRKNIINNYDLTVYTITFDIPSQKYDIITSLFPINVDLVHADLETCYVSYNTIELIYLLINKLKNTDKNIYNITNILNLIENDEIYYTPNYELLKPDHYIRYKSLMNIYNYQNKEFSTFYSFEYNTYCGAFGVIEAYSCDWVNHNGKFMDKHIHVAFFHVLSGEYLNVGVKLLTGELLYLDEIHFQIDGYKIIPHVGDTNSNIDNLIKIINSYNITHIIGVEKDTVRDMFSGTEFESKLFWISQLFTGSECHKNFIYTAGEYSLYRSVITLYPNDENAKHIVITQNDPANMETFFSIIGLSDKTNIFMIRIPIDRECEPFLLPHTDQYIIGSVFHLIISGPTQKSTVNYLRKLDNYNTFTVIFYNNNPPFPLDKIYDNIYFVGTIYKENEESNKLVHALDIRCGITNDIIYMEHNSGYNCMEYFDKILTKANSNEVVDVKKVLYSVYINAPDGTITIRKNNYGTRFFRIFQSESGSMRIILDDQVASEPNPWYLISNNSQEYQCDHQHNLGDKFLITRKRYIVGIIDSTLDTSPSEIQLQNTIKGLLETKYDSYYDILGPVDIKIITITGCLLPNMDLILEDNVILIISHIKSVCIIKYIPYLDESNKIMVNTFFYNDIICDKHIIYTAPDIKISNYYLNIHLLQYSSDIYFAMFYDNDDDLYLINYSKNLYNDYKLPYIQFEIYDDNTLRTHVRSAISTCIKYKKCYILYLLPYKSLSTMLSLLDVEYSVDFKIYLYCPYIPYKLIKDLISYQIISENIEILNLRSKTDEESCELQTDMYYSNSCAEEMVFESILELYYMTSKWLDAVIYSEQYIDYNLLRDYLYNEGIVNSINAISYHSYIYSIKADTSYIFYHYINYNSFFLSNGITYKCKILPNNDPIINQVKVIYIGYFYSLFESYSKYYNTYLLTFYDTISYINYRENENYYFFIYFYDISQSDEELLKDLSNNKTNIFFGGIFPEQKKRLSNLLLKYNTNAVLFYTGWSDSADCLCNTISFSATPEQYVNILLTQWGKKLYHTVIIYNSKRLVSNILPLITNFIEKSNFTIDIKDVSSQSPRLLFNDDNLPNFYISILDNPEELYDYMGYYISIKELLPNGSQFFAFFVTELMIYYFKPHFFDDVYIVLSSDQDFEINEYLLNHLSNIIDNNVFQYHQISPIFENTINSIYYWRSTVSRVNRFNIDNCGNSSSINDDDFVSSSIEYIDGTLNRYVLSNNAHFSRPVYMARFFENGTIIKYGVEYSVDPDYSPFSMKIPKTKCDCTNIDHYVGINDNDLYILIFPVPVYTSIDKHQSNFYMTLFAVADYFRSIFGSMSSYRWVLYILVLDFDQNIGVDEFKTLILQDNCVGVLGYGSLYDYSPLVELTVQSETFYFQLTNSLGNFCNKYYVGIGPTPNQYISALDYLVTDSNVPHVILLTVASRIAIKYAFQKQFKNRNNIHTHIIECNKDFDFNSIYKNYSNYSQTYIATVLEGNYYIEKISNSYSQLNTSLQSKFIYVFMSYYDYESTSNFATVFNNHFVISSYFHSVYSESSVVFQNYILYVSSNTGVVSETMECSYSTLSLIQTIFSSKTSFKNWNDIKAELYRALYFEYNLTTLSLSITSLEKINYFIRDIRVLQVSDGDINFNLKLYFNQIFRNEPIPFYGYPDQDTRECDVGPERILNRANNTVKTISMVARFLCCLICISSLLIIYYEPLFNLLGKEGKFYIFLFFQTHGTFALFYLFHPYMELSSASDCYYVKVYWMYYVEILIGFILSKILHLFLYRNCVVSDPHISWKITISVLFIFVAFESGLWLFDYSKVDPIQMTISEIWSDDLQYITVHAQCSGGSVFYVLRLIIISVLLLFSLFVFWRSRYLTIPNKSLLYVYLVDCLYLIIYVIFNGYIIMFLYDSEYEVINQIFSLDEPIFNILYFISNIIMRLLLTHRYEDVDDGDEKTHIKYNNYIFSSSILMPTVRDIRINSLQVSDFSIKDTINSVY